MKQLKITVLLLSVFVICSCNKPDATPSLPSDTSVQVTNSSANGKIENKNETVIDNSVKTPVVEEFIEKPVDPKDILPPMEAIKHLDDMVADYNLGQNLTPEQIQQNVDLKQNIIRGTFDIKELCRLSLGKHWDETSDEQHKYFVELMTKLLETKAIFSKEQLHGENKLYNINYQKETYDDAEKKKATVVTKMNVPKERLVLNITYKMLLTPYGWKIYDVIVDDASLLQNYKFQFDRIISTSGYEDLISRMKKKLEDISK